MRPCYYSIVLVICIQFCISASATEQTCDVVIVDGVEWYISGGRSPFKNMNREVYQLLDEFVNTSHNDTIKMYNIPEKIALEDYQMECTGCYRGYWAFWVIENGYLYLDDIHFVNDYLNTDGTGYKVLLKLYPQFVHDGRIRADWISGESVLLYIMTYDKKDPKHIRKFMTVKEGVVSFSRQFGENPEEKSIPLTKLIEEYLPLFFSTTCPKFYPGIYKATVHAKEECPGPSGIIKKSNSSIIPDTYMRLPTFSDLRLIMCLMP